uniref:Uncharacterized protein n=1 Tax=Cycas taitungensis TaxID=54799 RepID=A6H5G5_CYCTA|nr:hypothetical protein CYtaCp023 [Cycas taitungensis]BAF64931.1 hypothetical protein [Cycas taitungensis]
MRNRSKLRYREKRKKKKKKKKKKERNFELFYYNGKIDKYPFSPRREGKGQILGIISFRSMG